MPLRDHFHPPLSTQRFWESFHAAWIGHIKNRLNDAILPEEYFAQIEVSIGVAIEADVGTFEQEMTDTESPNTPGDLAVMPWAPPTPSAILSGEFPDNLAVRVLSRSAGPRLVAAVEMVSPRNKDRPESRAAFVAKCAAYLHRGVGLVIVDLVTIRLANLHHELLTALGQPTLGRLPTDAPPYAVSFRPITRDEVPQIDCWAYPLAIGQVLPTVPFSLMDGPTVPLEMELTYSQTCRSERM